ncbi:MAG: ABC transporter permease, partial [Planctomycetes bacterium]|nr:ABC transporter permease [Planctomycetota bacterium]
MLTLVGVVVGVATIIAIVSMITGMNQFVATQISSLGANTFILDRHGIITSEEQWWERRSWKKITVADMKVIQENCESCELVGGRTFVRRQIKNGNRYVDGAIVMGSTANFPLIVDFD